MLCQCIICMFDEQRADISVLPVRPYQQQFLSMFITIALLYV